MLTLETMSVEALSAPSIWNLTDAALALAASSIAVIAFVASTSPGSRFLVRRVLTTARRRTVVKVLTSHRLGTRKAASASARRLTNVVLDGGHHDANSELEWLATFQNDGMPIAFALTSDVRGRNVLDELAAAYERMAGKWRSRLVFGTQGSEVVSSMAKVAEMTALILSEHASNVPLPAPNDDAMDIDLRARGHYARVLYTTRNLELAISPHPGRLPGQADLLIAGGPQPRFEGILPHLLGERLELDQRSGRHRLHLAVAEMPYSSLLARNVPWDVGDVPTSSQTHAVSLALLPVTSDGHILLVRRSSSAGSYPGMIGPFVTGNAELRDRRGLRADRDEAGLPDLLGAVCREAREEVGLALEPNDLRVLGLARIWSPEDTAIWCLMTTTALEITTLEAAGLVRHGDHVEGSWEVGDELLAIDPWRTKGCDREVLIWAAGADLVPQAVASLAALLRKSGTDVAIDWPSAAARSTEPTAPFLSKVALRHPFR